MTNLQKLLAWAKERKHPSGFIGARREIESLSDDVGYIDRMLAKHAGDASCPCEAAALAVDPTFRVGVEHDGHWVKEPCALPSKIGESWQAVVSKLSSYSGEPMEVIDDAEVKTAVIPASEMQRSMVRGTASPLDLDPSVFKAGLDRRKSNRAALMDWIKSSLVEGTDFGSIPTKRGHSKPSLWKPGAEKICGMLGVTVSYPNFDKYENVALEGKQIHSVILRCELLDNAGNIVAEGVGARSLEQDYGDLNKCLKMASKSAHIDATLRMAGISEVFTQDIEDMPQHQMQQEPQQEQPRQQQQQRYPDKKVCPVCMAQAVGRSQYPPRNDPDGPKGWFCYPKSGGCGKVFPHDDPSFSEKGSEIQASVDEWMAWAATPTITVDTMNRVCKESGETDWKKWSKEHRVAVWNAIVDVAKGRGWEFNPKTKSFFEVPE